MTTWRLAFARRDGEKMTSKIVCHLVLSAFFASGWLALAGQTATEGRTWTLIRSVKNPYGGTQDLILIPEARKRDEKYYLQIANAVCGEKVQCMVHFWTDRAHIPRSADMLVEDLAVMTAEYERHPNYSKPVLQLACWLYPNKESAERAKCTYQPGAKVPWK